MSKKLLIIPCIILFTSCASTYNTLNIENETYYDYIATDNLTLSYKYDILQSSKNLFYAKKEKRKGLKIVAICIENKTDTLVKFNDDIKLKINGNAINYKNSFETFNLIKQNPAIYLLGIFTLTFSSGSNGYSSGLYISPFGVLYAIPNSIIAGNANGKLNKDLNKYDVSKLSIPPHEKGYALLCFKNNTNSPLELNAFNKDYNLSDVNISKNNNSAFNNIDSILHYSVRYGSFEKYYDTLMIRFKQDPSFIEIKIDQEKYSNGNLKYIGLKAKHGYGFNNEYPYKIGTWQYFYKNGQLKKYIDYNLTEKKNGMYKKFDESGNLIENMSYNDNKPIISNLNTSSIKTGKAIIELNNGNELKCKIVKKEEDKIYFTIYRNGNLIESFIELDRIKKIIYE